MLSGLRRGWQSRLLRTRRIPAGLWQASVEPLCVLSHLDDRQRVRLRELASLFLLRKSFYAAQGIRLSADMQAIIAAQACLLILELDLDYYDGWQEIIVYPSTFVVQQQEHDAAGVVHETRRALGGEAWGRGPVILSWEDARPGAQPHGAGSNVILHEFAHKLDMLNGSANGMPPLHAEMQREDWTEAMSVAYDDLYRQIERHHHTRIDPYAAESPAEFFAVISELFFELPGRLYHFYPRVYQQLQLFYRQDPLGRRGVALGGFAQKEA